ncbi:MAG: hypothetical protein WC924_02340 [Candidatus Gracilibacteria bacterium]
MKKNFLVLTMVLAIVALFVGCGRAGNPSDATGSDTADEEADVSDLLEAQQEIAENYDPNDPESVADAMEAYAEYAAQIELEEFEEMEAVDAPEYFPEALIYNKGKITESSDYGDEGYIDKSITIETTEDLKTVKEFYKDLFSQMTWDLTSQSSESDSASFDATDSAAIDAYIYIYADPYSKLVRISVSYSGYITE